MIQSDFVRNKHEGESSRGGFRPKYRAASCELCSSCQYLQETLPVDAVFERFASIDENYWDFIVVFLPQLGIRINVYLAPLKVHIPLQLS